ncbi:LOW QUALITY PROTEIN: DNA mismatch repair protein Mlh3 [Microcaecilia unicolor]|uniref:LOW QUALITY PROTEIN: DNA mismatch repair protein Mlh3 n=1 Tax=Microcaecilia unicolor TaxID=1415580 RepID=A0A6P7Z1Y2_9AMPH|nr:LOW QUALITY PROTEIN: DNA mismatch repair protein Mlh3 [Microcaecilia unicolor]
MIRLLPEEVRASLRSGLSVSSAVQCVQELLLNSIDAQATCVAIRVDMERLRLQVVDNGRGMSPEDVEKVGSRYFSSKCHSLADLEELRFYGFRGEALASIVDMASVVEIASRTTRSPKTVTKLFQNGKAHQVSEAEQGRPSVGTTVTVCNLFYNLPVRRRCVDSSLELERLRQRVEAVALMHPAVSFSLRNDATALMLLQLPKTKDVYTRFAQIFGLTRAHKLREIHFSHKGFALNGYINSEGHYNKNMQFLYVNGQLILKTRLHKLINFLLKKESSICKLKSGPLNRQTNLSPPRHRSAAHLHGVYVINIKCHYSEYDVCIEPNKTLMEFKNWDRVMHCIEEGVRRFLNRENLFVEPSSEDVKDFNEKNDFKLLSTEVQHIVGNEVNVHNSFSKACRDIMDTDKLSNLRSKAAQRNTESVNPVVLENNSSTTQVAPDGTIVEPVDTVCFSGAERRDINSFSEEEHVNSENQETSICLQVAELKGISDESSELSHNVQIPLLTEDSEADIMILKCNQPETKPTNSTGIFIRDCNLMEQENITRKSYGVHETRDETNFVLETSSLERCDVRKKESKEPGSKERERDADSVAMELCFPGLRTHLMPNEVSKINKIKHDSLELFSRLGPVSSQEILGNGMNVSAQTENVMGLSGGLKKVASLQSREGHRYDVDSWKEMLTLKNRNPESFYVSDQSGRRGDSTWQCNDASLLNNSDVMLTKGFINRQTTTKQLVFSNPRKLSLVAHVGSLERFRRHYGKRRVLHLLKMAITNVVLHPLSLTTPECPRHRNNFESFSDCENTNAKSIGSKNNSLATLASDNFCNQPVEKCLNSKDDILLDSKITWLERQPQIQLNYTLHQNKFANSPLSLSLLATKSTTMKGNQAESVMPEEAKHFVEESQSNLSHRDNTACELVEANEAINQRQKLSEYSQTESHKLNYIADRMSNSSSNTASCNAEETVECSVFTTGEFADNPNINPDLEDIKACPADKCTNVFLEQDYQTGEFPDIALPHKLKEEAASKLINDGNSPTSCDWLHYFDVSLGRTVYVNKATGLSSYSAPSEENQTVCSKDLTTLAVNVVSRIGSQYRCHPFRSDVILPFLPRPREERDMARQKYRDDEAAVGSLRSLFLEWENPVFARHSEVAVDVSSCLAQRLAVKIHNILYPYRFTKEMIHSMQVLKQVDNKFIACLISTKNEETAVPDGNLLVLVDQHAAHERIRLEQLITESYELQPDMSGRKKLLSSTVYPALQVEVTEEERRLLRSYQRSLEELGLGVSFPEASVPSVLVHTVPLCFVEKEATEARRGRSTVTKSIVKEFIREQVELLQTAGGARGSLPPTVLKVLASQACHGAIKFNNSLSAEESCSLIKALSRCQLPFQCAHGRPSMLPIADTDHLQPNTQETPAPNLKRLRKMFKAWQLFKQ